MSAIEQKHQDFHFELKEISETGTFTGYASVYGVTDLGGDVVEKGAFSKTIKERPTVPICWQHDAPVGLGELEDSEAGLIVKGKLTLGTQTARDALALMKDKVVKGLSIGFTTVKSDVMDGVRHLKEIRLWEVSLVTFPALPAAQITSVKRAEAMEREQKMDFTEALDNVQTWSARYQYMDALDSAICSSLYDDDLTTADAVAQIGVAVDQFKESMTALCPKLRDLMNASYGMDFKKLFEMERKAGRRLSAASRAKIEEVQKQLQALLADEAAAEEDEGKAAHPPESKSTSDPGAAAPSIEPVDHSQLISQIDKLKGQFQWQ